MLRRTEPLPAWTWDQLEAALGAFPQTRSAQRMLEHHLAGLQAEQAGMTSGQLLLEILSLAAMLAAPEEPAHPALDGTDPLLGPSQGEC